MKNNKNKGENRRKIDNKKTRAAKMLKKMMNLLKNKIMKMIE